MMDQKTANDSLQAGTGFMMNLTDAIRKLSSRGYCENLVPRFDHLECRSGEIKLYPEDFVVEEMIRFENSSDPDDQSILYLVRSPSKGLRGLYVESYGLYHDDLSDEMQKHLRSYHRAH